MIQATKQTSSADGVAWDLSDLYGGVDDPQINRDLETALQRAQAFEAAMQQMGASSVLRVFGDAKHEITSEMRLAACTFLGKAMQPRAPFGSPLAEAPVRY